MLSMSCTPVIYEADKETFQGEEHVRGLSAVNY